MNMVLRMMLYLIYQRSKDLYVELRSGVSPLNVQNGLYVSLKEEKRICSMWCLNYFLLSFLGTT